MVTNKFLIDLSYNQDVIFENCKRYFDRSNFMFGQSEVILTKAGVLQINRKNKYKKLKGTLLDRKY